MDDYKRLYETACSVGDIHARQVVKYANLIRIQRGVIWKALTLLRTGRAALAHDVLEQHINKDQQS